MNQIRVERRELKYKISLLQFKRLEARLGLAMERDSFAGADGGYNIRTLYFDTPYESDFYATRQGEEIRKKIRMRCYSPDAQTVKLERKAKFGQDQAKTSLNLTRTQARQMIQEDYGFLAQMEDGFAKQLYCEICQGGYRPNMFLEYKRIPFVAPSNHIRITFDYDIRYTKSEMDIFVQNPPMTPLTYKDWGILEVKYDGFLFSYIKELLGGIQEQQVAFGKYAEACAQIYS